MEHTLAGDGDGQVGRRHGRTACAGRVDGRKRLGELLASRHGIGRSLPFGGVGPATCRLNHREPLGVVCEGRRVEGRVVAPHYPRLALYRRGPGQNVVVQSTSHARQTMSGRGHPEPCDDGNGV